ncbi:MAG: GNAT family N-acetyltransferase [Rhodobacteraceae bacterium]|nr:GNAT family N-acetyltransferase [Paracoccaceae bacterium]
MIRIRRALPTDTREMAELLNAIIATGGTTAFTSRIAASDLADWMAADTRRSAWHVATDSEDTVQGFQWIGPHRDLPPEAADIATFVREGQTRLGIGSALFQATESAARRLGYAWLNATIRADNAGGLIYYQSRGFRPWHRDKDVVLGNGLRVDKISKRYDL